MHAAHADIRNRKGRGMIHQVIEEIFTGHILILGNGRVFEFPVAEITTDHAGLANLVRFLESDLIILVAQPTNKEAAERVKRVIFKSLMMIRIVIEVQKSLYCPLIYFNDMNNWLKPCKNPPSHPRKSKFVRTMVVNVKRECSHVLRNGIDCK